MHVNKGSAIYAHRVLQGEGDCVEIDSPYVTDRKQSNSFLTLKVSSFQ